MPFMVLKIITVFSSLIVRCSKRIGKTRFGALKQDDCHSVSATASTGGRKLKVL